MSFGFAKFVGCGGSGPSTSNTSSCGCSSGCNESCSSSGYNVAVYDDNGSLRPLIGSGILIGKDGQVFHTNGSLEQGVIDIDPENTGGIDSILGIVSGTLVQIGYGAPDGSSLILYAGKWQVVSNQTKNSVYDPTKIRTGAKIIAGFTCSENGMVELGKISPVANTVLYWDDEGNFTPLTPASLATNLTQPLCETTLEVPDTETVLFYLVCTENGVRKTTNKTKVSYWHDPKPLIYYQGKYNGVSPGGPIIGVPPLPSPVAGYFVSEYVDVDLTLLPGYSTDASAVILDCLAGIYNRSAASWHAVLVIEGLERIRINSTSDGGANGFGSNSENQVWIPIPSNKKIRVETQRQGDSTSAIETATIAVRLTAFMSL